MLRLFKKYFIPHKHNNHKPHILRYEAILFILSVALVAEIYFLAQVFILAPFTNIFSSIIPSVLTDMTNLNRENDDLSALTVNPILVKAAELKAQDMAANGYFAHESPSGKTPWHWLDATGYKFITAGENLAVNFIDSQDIANAWMNSPKHRENILNNNFTEIGIATARGIYQGKETIFVAQFFGRPAGSTQKQTSSKTIPSPSINPAPIARISPKISPAPRATEITQQKNTVESFSLVMGESETAETTPTPPAETKLQNTPVSLTSLNYTSPDTKISLPSKIKQFLSTPRVMTNYLFIMLLTIISLALILKIFIKISIRHPSLIVNGLFTLLFISSLMWLNQFLTLSQARIF